LHNSIFIVDIDVRKSNISKFRDQIKNFKLSSSQLGDTKLK